MEFTTCTILMTLIIGLVLYLLFRRPDPRLPPWPVRPWPIVGHLFIVKDDTRPQFKKWREEVGDLFSLYMGGTLMVVMSSYDLMKETFVKRGDEFNDRPMLFIDEATGMPGTGVIMSSGAMWKEQRSATVSFLRAFGMGKNVLAEKVQEEIGFYLEALAKLNGEAADLRVATNISMANNVMAIITGQRYEYDDEFFQDLMKKLHFIAQDLSASNVLTFLPWLRYLPGDLFKAKKTELCAKQILDVMYKLVKLKGHEEYDDANIDNFIAAYMKELKKKTTANEATTMSEDQLARTIWDIFNAGTETAATTLLWGLLYLLHYPDVQEKIYQEMEREIGTDRAPSMLDKAKLTYLNAFISEVQRIANVTGTSLAHSCPTEVTLRGYTFPKGTYFLPNMDSIFYDEAIWGEEVHTLKPERFIDGEGKLKNFEEFIPFGLGRRACPGEGVAKMELFLYLSSMLQRFKFLSPDPASPPPLDYIVGLDINPVPYKIRVIDRKADA